MKQNKYNTEHLEDLKVSELLKHTKKVYPKVNSLKKEIKTLKTFLYMLLGLFVILLVIITVLFSSR